MYFSKDTPDGNVSRLKSEEAGIYWRKETKINELCIYLFNKTFFTHP